MVDKMTHTDDSSLPWLRPTYRDRHGRGQRRPLFGAWLPRYRTQSGMFDRIAEAEVQRLAHAWPDLFQSIRCTVEDVPPTDPLPWEDQFVLRSRAFPAQHHQPARIVIYRRPLQTISSDPADLQILIREELVARLAELTGLNPEDIDPSYGDDE
jgi:predicted Zn-dependent protease with MMP-like domain